MRRWKGSVTCRLGTSNGNEGVLKGKKIAIKANIAVKDAPLTCASRMLENYQSPFDATVVSRLKEAGAQIHMITNMDEFGMGSFSTSGIFGPVIQQGPDGHAYTAGGSSGGSALAVAQGEAWAALGSDTGGSVRLPASYCGVVGLKPTYGLLSRFGLVSYASSLDTIGIITKDVKDSSLLLSVLNSGLDAVHDSTNIHVVKKKVNVVDSIEDVQSLEGKRIGIPQALLNIHLDAEVLQFWESSAKWLIESGARIVPIEMPALEHSLPAYYIIAPAEAASNLARYDGLRYGAPSSENIDKRTSWYRSVRSRYFGNEVKRRILAGNFVLSHESFQAYFAKAQQVRSMLCDQFRQQFEDNVDLMLMPTAASSAPSLDELKSESRTDKISTYAHDVLTVPSSLAGLPSISIPVGKGQSGLSIGMQFIAPPYHEHSLLNAAAFLEKAANT